MGLQNDKLANKLSPMPKPKAPEPISKANEAHAPLFVEIAQGGWRRQESNLRASSRATKTGWVLYHGGGGVMKGNRTQIDWLWIGGTPGGGIPGTGGGTPHAEFVTPPSRTFLP